MQRLDELKANVLTPGDLLLKLGMLRASIKAANWCQRWYWVLTEDSRGRIRRVTSSEKKEENGEDSLTLKD
jgi:hypothetical protein